MRGYGIEEYGASWYGYFVLGYLYGGSLYALSFFGAISDDIARALLGWSVRKKLGRSDLPDPLGLFGIWQMRMTKRGKVPIRMKFYTPTNPRTVPQQANRQKFADAMAAWQELTDEQKDAYNVRAKKRGWFGRNLFIREYYQSN